MKLEDQVAPLELAVRDSGMTVDEFSCRCRLLPPLPDWKPPAPRGAMEWIEAFFASDIPLWIGYVTCIAGAVVAWVYTIYHLARAIAP